jgi:hypothetical protein
MLAERARDLPPLLIAALCGVIPVIHEAGLLAALPLLLLVLPLLAGRYPGERTLERLRKVAARPRRPRSASARKPIAPRRRSLLRTRLLIAASLAERAPPPPAAI